MLGGTAKEHRMAKVVRDEAGEGLDLQWSPQRWGSLGSTLGSHGSLQSKGGLVCMTLWAGSPDLISATSRLLLLPGVSTGTKEPPCRPLESSTAPWASHQACVIRVHTLGLLHHAGEAAGTGRGAGEVLQHFCSLGRRLRSATDSTLSACVCSGHLLGHTPLPCPGRPSLQPPRHLCGPHDSCPGLEPPPTTVLPNSRI